MRLFKRLSPLLLLAAAACATAPVAEEPVRPPQPVEPRPAEPVRDPPVRVGVIVSSTGPALMQRYGELVLEGARLGAEVQTTSRRPVELVIRDDGGTAAGAARALRELEQGGVRVVVGPLVDDALTAAARARSSDDVVIISPMATASPAGVRNAYALNAVDALGGAALGEYARRYARVGVLYSRTADATRQARAFMEAYSRGGHGNAREVPFDSGANNVATQLTRLREARVEAIFIPGSERELQIVLPQVDYFGMSGVQLMGTESWLSDANRSLPPRVLQGAIIATPLWRESNEIGWREFVARYEERYRRSLDNAVPALGHDAVLLALRAAAGSAAVSNFRGATGVLSLEAGGVTRRPFLVRYDAGRLVPVN